MSVDIDHSPVHVESVVRQRQTQQFRVLSTRPYASQSISPQLDRSSLMNSWEAAPPGCVSTYVDATGTTNSLQRTDSESSFYTPGIEEHALDELRATAIAGNDISSSCLYATGLVAQAAGKYGPLSSSLVCFTLYLFQNIYSEVFSALPMNGGTYTALLNTTSKGAAALAAILSTLSYTATAVTSAASAAEYVHHEWEVMSTEVITISILGFFALLTLLGIKDSANTATFFFLLHLAIMCGVLVSSFVFVIRDGGQILRNSFNSTSQAANPHGNIPANLFYGFCSALLGVTGFETSSNYIEEQKKGVFPKTLFNMWLAITLLNPALSVLAMGVIPIEQLVSESNYCLASMAQLSVGDWFRMVVVFDAALVLSGAVLTAYVGIVGLHRRLALDRVMPAFFLRTNKLRGTNHVIILSFCGLTVSLRLLVSDMDTLGGVYAISFLAVMILFCISNICLKLKRERLKRSPITSPWVVVVAAFLVSAGCFGNLVKSPLNAQYFLLYFIVFAAIVLATRLQVPILRFIARLTISGLPRGEQEATGEHSITAIPEVDSENLTVPLHNNHRFSLTSRISLACQNYVNDIRNCPVVFFTKTASLHTINKAVEYVMDNENSNKIKIVHFFGAGLQDIALDRDGLPGNATERDFIRVLEHECSIIDRLYPKLTIDLLLVHGQFQPIFVDQLSTHLGILKNFMLMTCPGDSFPHRLGQFGGVRVVTH